MFDFPFHSTGITGQREAPLGYIGSGKADAWRDHSRTPAHHISRNQPMIAVSRGAAIAVLVERFQRTDKKARSATKFSSARRAAAFRWCWKFALYSRHFKSHDTTLFPHRFTCIWVAESFRAFDKLLSVVQHKFCVFPPALIVWGRKNFPQVLFRDCLWCLRVYECLLEVELLSSRREKIATLGWRLQCCLNSIELF